MNGLPKFVPEGFEQVPYFMEHCTPQMYKSLKTHSYVDIGGGGYSTMGFSMLTMESIESIVFNEFHTLENVGLDINMLSIESFFISNDSKHPVTLKSYLFCLCP